jgi:CHAT domain-containing protein
LNKPLSQLVVLSACESANGKLYQGEGIFSFNRGFAALGIPSCISNLWSVNNKATYELTELFYQQSVIGLPLDIALQKAKLEYFKKNTSNQLPYYWAAEILVGRTDSIASDIDSSPIYFFAGLLISLFLFVLWFRMEQKNK